MLELLLHFCKPPPVVPEKVSIVGTVPVPGSRVAQGPLPGEGPVGTLLHIVRVRAGDVVMDTHAFTK
jgi:hypothetical protein